MKFIYVIKEYIKVAFKCLKYVYYKDKKGTIFRLGVLFMFPIINNIINLINARLTDRMQENFGTGFIQYILPVFSFLILFTILDSLFSFLSNKLSYAWQSKLNREVYIDQLVKKKDFTIPFVDSSDSEELDQRIRANGNGPRSQVILTRSIPEFVTIVMNLLFTTYIVYSYNYIFAIIVILSSLPVFHISFTRSFALIKDWEGQLDEIKRIHVYSSMFTGYQALKDAKSSNNADKLINIYRKGQEQFQEGQLKIYNHYVNLAFIAGLLTTVVIFVIQYFVIKDVAFGSMLIGQATLIIVQVARLNNNMKEFSNFLPNQYENVVTSKYLFLQAETLENTDKKSGTVMEIQNDKIEFKNINFHYTDTKFEGLHKLNKEIDSLATKYFGLKKTQTEKKEKDPSNFNLHIDKLVINKGEKIAVVGKNGNGKTTFAQLLLNIYQPQSGDILLFGNNMRDLSQETISQNFSTLYQDYSQNNMKVHQYIALSEKNKINIDRVKSSAKIATADEFIEKWDGQYTQQLGVHMKGVKPSKGQWQKLALARTFYKDSSIIILDEPTASIDALSSKKIFQNLSQIDKEKTLILISHNMTDIVNFADRIIVFDKGRIVGDGTHTDLLKSCEIYRDLYESESR